MTLPRPLVLFLAFCGGGALFAMPLLLAAFALGTPASPAAAADSPTPHPSAATDEVIGTLTFRAFDLGFDPATVEVEQAGRYAVKFVNDGAILHDITFADGTVVSAEAGTTAKGEVVVPAEGLGYICSIPGHPDAGMPGPILVSRRRHAGHGGASPSPAGNPAGPAIEPDPNAPEYTPRDPAAPALAKGTLHEIELMVTETTMTVAPGIVQQVWTFGDQVPGPVMRVTVGDTVRITLKNPDTNKLPHSVDFHA